jgi:hypothetical protein
LKRLQKTEIVSSTGKKVVGKSSFDDKEKCYCGK